MSVSLVPRLSGEGKGEFGINCVHMRLKVHGSIQMT